MINDYIIFFFKTFASVFVIMGPFSVLPIFLSLTTNNTAEEKEQISKRATRAAGALCLIFMSFGGFFFKIFGITIPSFQIAGGILLLLMAINMLHAKRSKIRVTPTEQQESMEKEDISIFPLAIPIIAGPGAISTVILLANDIKAMPEWIIMGASIVLSAYCLYLLLKLSDKIYNVLGNTGINIVTRIMGLILASIAIEYITKGIKASFNFLT